MRIPTLREARAAARLDIAGREALHAACPHEPGRCAIEAAETVAASRRDLVTVALALACSWLVTVATAVAFPNWTTYMGRSNEPQKLWLIFAVFAGACTAFVLVREVPRARRSQLEARAVAAAGPRCDPWPVALTWKGRRPRSPRLPMRALFLVPALALSGVVLALTGSLVVAGLVAAFAGYYLSLLSDGFLARHQKRHDGAQRA